MKKILPLIMLLLPVLAFGQIDTRFWFAPPMHTNGTASESTNNPRNRPIFMVVSTLNQPAQVIISQPANLSFVPIVLNMPANTTQQVNLTAFFNQIETKPANEIKNSGLLIRSTRPITAYYELRSQNNTDIYALKGKNALGTKFYTPYEDSYGSNQQLGGSPYLPGPRAGFIVIATEDNTTVTITPKIDVLGHPAGVPFDIVLMRGQTYYVEAIDEDVSNKPIGTLIESDKPIAVTVKDDMIDTIIQTDSNADVAGDQLMSYDFTGLRHIVVKGELSNNADRVAVLATVDGTEVFIDGSDTPILLNEGEQHVYNLVQGASYIESTEKIYVFHASGLGKQLAGAVIPSLECTGSNQVGFVRASSSDFFLLLTIRAGSEGNFALNGNPALIPASAFQPVPGTDGLYVYAKIGYSTAQIPSGTTGTVTNFSDELFHMGIISKPGGATANYGYFSAFSFLNIGTNSEVCLGDTLTLDAGPGKTAYLWNTGETTQTIDITDPGEYFVEVFSGSDCFATDTIMVTYYEPPVSLGANDTICAGTSKVIEIEGNFLFNWSDGSTGPSIEVSEEGWIWVEVTDFQDCRLRDSTFISVRPRPETPTISGDTIYCAGETLTLNLSDADNASYRFIRPNEVLTFNQTLEIADLAMDDAGTYFGFIVVEGCESFSDSVNVQIIPSPQVSLPDDAVLCDGETFIIEADIVGDVQTLTWQDESNGPSFIATESGTYHLTAVNAAECVGSDTIVLVFNPLPQNPVLDGDLAACEGETVELSVQSQEGVTYTWTDTQENILSTSNSLSFTDVTTANSGSYDVQATLENCVSEILGFDIVVSENPVVVLPNDTIICVGDEVILNIAGDFASYSWSNGSTEPLIVVGDGTFEITVTNEAGCEGSDIITVEESGPTADFGYTPQSQITPELMVAFGDLSDPGEGIITNRFWDFGDGTTSTSTNPNHQFLTAGDFIVQLTVTDSRGCANTTSQVIEVRFDLRIPDGFSPNGDGVGDLFIIRGLESYPGSTLQIFNRWGSVIYESNNYPNNWDGGNTTDGTYFYILKLSNGEDFSGSVTIAR